MFYFPDEREQNVPEVEPDKSSLLFHKELETEDAVYNIYLKKCTFNSFTGELPLEQVDGGALVSFRTKEVKVLKAGTLPRIVEALAPESGELDSMLVRTFLSTYRSFASSKDVLNLLIQRHASLAAASAGADVAHDGPPQKAAVLSVVFIWLDLYPEDFDEPPDYACLHLLEDFLLPLCGSCSSTQAVDLRSTVTYMLSKCSSGNGFDSQSSNGNSGSFHASGARSRLQRKPSTTRQRLPSGGGDTVAFQERAPVARSLDDEDSKSKRFISFSLLSAETLAEQLTLMDAELFMNVRPYQCLGSMWNRSGGGRSRNIHCSSVVATVDQFNSVIHRVMATVLKDIDLKHSKRAKVIEKWIQVARQLRNLKNFSSLRAVVSGLQSGAVFRLQKAWRSVSKEHRAAYGELSQIFSEDNNHVASRELLNKEGTAKVASVGSLDRQTSKKGSVLMRTASKLFALRTVSSEQGSGMCYGTVPYLGTFLTDLTMIDTALSDCTEGGLINLEKRRREFDILAQIQLYQSSAKLYNLEADQDFLAWFHSCRTYSESESFELSYAIEPLHTPSSSSTSSSTKGRVSRTNSSLFYSATSLTSLGDDDLASSLDSSSASSECAVVPLSAMSPRSTSSATQWKAPTAPSGGPCHRRSSQSSESSGDLDAIATPLSADQCLVRVHWDRGCGPKAPVSADSYKTILLTNKAKAHNVIKTTLEKFHADEQETSRFCLVQLLEKKKELQIPDDANVFYAMDNTQIISEFVVRDKPRLPSAGSILPDRMLGVALNRVNKNATFP